MSSSDDMPHPYLPEAGDGPSLRAPPKALVRAAGGVILVLACLGLIRGVLGARPASETASPLSVLAGLNPAAAASAKPAVILPRDETWSTLSGPRLVDASEKPKAETKPAESDDEEDDSDSPAAQTAAADAIAPDAPDAAPTPPAAASSAPPAQTPPT